MIEYRIVYSDEDVKSVKFEFLKKGIVLSRLRFLTYRRYFPPHPVRTETEIIYCHAASKFQELMIL